MSPSKQKQTINKLAKEYDIKVYWTKNCDGSGFHKVNPRTKTDSIYILDNPEDNDFLSTFFHELGHSYCYRNKIWPAYHHVNARHRNGRMWFTTPDLKAKIRTGYKAECWVDRWAEKEMAKRFPNLVYDPGYVGKPMSKIWLSAMYLEMFRYMLRKRKA